MESIPSFTAAMTALISSESVRHIVNGSLPIALRIVS